MNTEAPSLENKHKENTFSSLAHLDVRILRALADQSFAKPTLVQAKAIPLALEGKDILCRAKTGSGKTVAYCVPVLERVLVARKVVSLLTTPLIESLLTDTHHFHQLYYDYRRSLRMKSKPPERWYSFLPEN